MNDIRYKRIKARLQREIDAAKPRATTDDELAYFRNNTSVLLPRGLRTFISEEDCKQVKDRRTDEEWLRDTFNGRTAQREEAAIQPSQAGVRSSASEWSDWIEHKKGDPCPIPWAKAGDWEDHQEGHEPDAPNWDASRYQYWATTQSTHHYRYKLSAAPQDAQSKPLADADGWGPWRSFSEETPNAVEYQHRPKGREEPELIVHVTDPRYSLLRNFDNELCRSVHEYRLKVLP